MAFTMEFGTGFEMGQIPVRGGAFIPGDMMIEADLADVHTGAYCIQMKNTGGAPAQGRFQLPTPRSDLYFGVWIRPPSAVSGYEIRLLIDLALTVHLRYDGSCWDAYVNNVLVSEGAVSTAANAWQHIQCHVVIDNVGTIETIIDGIPDISYSGDTQPGAVNQVTTLAFGATTYYRPYWVDDLVIGYGGWPGDIRFDPIYVTGDVAGGCDWSPSVGSDHYALVDEVPPSSADYVYVREDLGERYETPGTWDDTDGLGNVVKDPLAVIVWADVRKQDGNQDDKLSLIQSDGSNEVAQSAESLLTSYENRWYIRELAPDGGEWTTAKVNTLVIGLEADVEEVV